MSRKESAARDKSANPKIPCFGRNKHVSPDFSCYDLNLSQDEKSEAGNDQKPPSKSQSREQSCQLKYLVIELNKKICQIKIF